MREHKNDQKFNHEDVYALMMDALDGEITAEGQRQLETHLHLSPDLAHEWDTMQMIDLLLTEAPMMAPPVDFAVQTIARLPNLKARRWLTAAIYTIIFLSGLLPFAILGWLLGSANGILIGPAFLDSAAEFLSELLQITNVIFNAIGQLLLGFGDFAGQQPAFMGFILVMVGSIVLWSGVYQQFTSEQPQTA